MTEKVKGPAVGAQEVSHGRNAVIQTAIPTTIWKGDFWGWSQVTGPDPIKAVRYCVENYGMSLNDSFLAVEEAINQGIEGITYYVWA